LFFSLEKENRLSLGAGVDGKYAFGLAEPRKKKKKEFSSNSYLATAHASSAVVQKATPHQELPKKKREK